MASSNGSVNRILVVEDEPAISQVCRRVLGREGFEVDSAVNGEVAQGMLRKKDYDPPIRGFCHDAGTTQEC